MGCGHVENLNIMQPNADPEHLAELYQLAREYEAALQVASDLEEKWRLYRILQEIRACIIEIENDAKSA